MSEKCSILCVECVAGLIIYDKISSAHFFYSKPPYVQYARFMCHQINIPEWLFVAMEHTSIYPLYIGYRFTQISRYKQHLMDVEMLQLFVRRFYSLHISLSLSPRDYKREHARYKFNILLVSVFFLLSF